MFFVGVFHVSRFGDRGTAAKDTDEYHPFRGVFDHFPEARTTHEPPQMTSTMGWLPRESCFDTDGAHHDHPNDSHCKLSEFLKT